MEGAFMPDSRNEAPILAHIQRLVNEEHRLFGVCPPEVVEKYVG
jgi:hypothetical protein